MGMFDRVMVPCPACDAPVEFQTKAGDCVLARLTPGQMSDLMKVDMAGEQQRCPVCGVTIGCRLIVAPQVEFVLLGWESIS
jgi:hypothetical protein